MSETASWWPQFGWKSVSKNQVVTKEEKLRELREQIHAISDSTVLDEAQIDDADILTLTREDLNELFPGVRNFNLRKTIMTLITDAAKEISSGNKDSPQADPKKFAAAVKNLMQTNSSNDPAVRCVLEECLKAFRETEKKLKAEQESLKPCIEILNSFIDHPARKRVWEQPNLWPTNSNSMQMQTNSSIMRPAIERPLRVHVLVLGRILETERQVLAKLRGIEEGGLDDSRLILVFYPITSRAGTNTVEALKQIPVNKPAVLVTMHHTFNHDFVCPTVNTRSSPADIVEHVNVLFHDSHPGVLNCPANDCAIDKLQHVLNRFR